MLTGEQIAELRRALGMTLKEFGELMGVTEATASRWESENRWPRRDKMERLNALAEKHGTDPYSSPAPSRKPSPQPA